MDEKLRFQEIVFEVITLPEAERRKRVNEWWDALTPEEQDVAREEIQQMFDAFVEAFRPIMRSIKLAINAAMPVINQFHQTAMQNPAYAEQFHAHQRMMQMK